VPNSLEEGLDLIAAIRASDVQLPTSADAFDPRRFEVNRSALTRANPPGVLPLLQALGRTVAKHAHAGYASLQEDPRFWTLIHLLQRLGRPTIEAVDTDLTSAGEP
jgi:hypothetical protein